MVQNNTMQADVLKKRQAVYGLEQIGKCREDELKKIMVRCGELDYAEVYRTMYNIPLMSNVNFEAQQLERLKAFLTERQQSGLLSGTEYRVLSLVFGTEERCFKEANFSKSEQEYIAKSTPEILKSEFNVIFSNLREGFLRIDDMALQRERRERLHDFSRNYEIRLAEILEDDPFEVEVGFYMLDYVELYLDFYDLTDEADMERIRDADVVLAQYAAIESLSRQQLLTACDMNLLEMLYGKIQCKLVDYPREVAIYRPDITYEKLLERLRYVFDLIRSEIVAMNR